MLKFIKRVTELYLQRIPGKSLSFRKKLKQLYEKFERKSIILGCNLFRIPKYSKIPWVKFKSLPNIFSMKNMYFARIFKKRRYTNIKKNYSFTSLKYKDNLQKTFLRNNCRKQKLLLLADIIHLLKKTSTIISIFWLDCGSRGGQ